MNFIKIFDLVSPSSERLSLGYEAVRLVSWLTDLPSGCAFIMEPLEEPCHPASAPFDQSRNRK